jgi:hypothetical protein
MAELPFIIKMGIVVAIWVAIFLLLMAVNDRLDARAKATESANPGQAKAKAESLIFSLGNLALLLIHAALSLWAGVNVLMAFMIVASAVSGGSWIRMPDTTFLIALGLTTPISVLLSKWISNHIHALD